MKHPPHKPHLRGIDRPARALHHALFDILSTRLEESGLTVVDAFDIGSYAGGEVLVGGRVFKILVVPPDCNVSVVHRLAQGVDL